MKNQQKDNLNGYVSESFYLTQIIVDYIFRDGKLKISICSNSVTGQTVVVGFGNLFLKALRLKYERMYKVHFT